MTSSRAIVFCVVLVLMCGCGSGTTGPTADGVRLTASVDRDTIGGAIGATLRFRLENTTDRSQTLSFTSGCQVMVYIARRDNGAVVYPPGGGWGCTTALTELMLAPSGSKVQDVQVKLDSSAVPPVVGLPQGEYLAYAKLGPPYSVQSNSVALTVVTALVETRP